MTSRRFLPLLGSLAVGATLSIAPLAAGTASAQTAPYGPGPCTANVTASPSTVAAGGSLTVGVTGNCDNQSLSATLASSKNTVTLGSIATNSSGQGSNTFTVPSNLHPGSYQLQVANAAGLAGATKVNVASSNSNAGGASNSKSGNGLAFTGTDAAMTAGFGAVAVGAGGILILSARRRRGRRFQ